MDTYRPKKSLNKMSYRKQVVFDKRQPIAPRAFETEALHMNPRPFHKHPF